MLKTETLRIHFSCTSLILGSIFIVVTWNTSEFTHSTYAVPREARLTPLNSLTLTHAVQKAHV